MCMYMYMYMYIYMYMYRLTFQLGTNKYMPSGHSNYITVATVPICHISGPFCKLEEQGHCVPWNKERVRLKTHITIIHFNL